MWTPVIVSAVFYLLIAAAAWQRPQGTRFFLGFFFVVCGLGINGLFLLLNPGSYAHMADHAFLPIARAFFQDIVAPNTTLFIIPVILLETVVGVVLLMRGPAVRIAFITASVFLLAVTFIGVEMLANPILAATTAALAFQPADRDFLDVVMNKG